MTIYALCEKPYVNKQRFFDSFSKGASTKVLNTFLACFDIPLTPSLYKKWSFPLRISSVIVTKSVVTFAEEILNRKRHFCVVLVRKCPLLVDHSPLPISMRTKFDYQNQ